MKMDMSAKPTGENMPESNEGTYDQEHMECMLKYYLEAKKIEADPKIFAMVKDYAMSKNKMVEELFKQENKTPVKSLKDLKTKYNEKMMADMESEGSDEKSEEEEA
jgi:hypothetical protein